MDDTAIAFNGDMFGAWWRRLKSVHITVCTRCMGRQTVGPRSLPIPCPACEATGRRVVIEE